MKLQRLVFGGLMLCALLVARPACADAPAWMHAQTSAPLPPHDAETSAILLYSETVLTVQGPGKLRRTERKVYRILRPEGAAFGNVRITFDSQTRVTSLHAWSIPASGKDYEVRDRDIVESGLPIQYGDLVNDVRTKHLSIPSAIPGTLVGYEVEQEQRPYAMSDEWDFQETVPVREARYSVKLPPGWSYKTFWLNHLEGSPSAETAGPPQWVVGDVKAIKVEEQMPPWRGIAGRMVISLVPPQGQSGSLQSWREVGTWYSGLTRSRREASPEIKHKVHELTATAPTMLAKMQALAAFVQKDIRYVAIELGIGGVQPHPAAEVFTQGFGDCKDKATLLSSMLKEIGVESHYVIINTQRGSITGDTPPNLGFDHVILAIQLPAGFSSTSWSAVVTHPKLGTLLFFDPTNELMPFGQLGGSLQANYGMLAAPEGGELIRLPQTPIEVNGVRRTAKLTLDEAGTLRGEVSEVWAGDMGVSQRWARRSALQDIDQIKPLESMLSQSLGTFQILQATVGNAHIIDKPFEWHYTLESTHYAKSAGDLLLVRPRVFGSLSSGLLETKESRQYPIEFDAPARSTDVFEITVPASYGVDELPPAVNEDLGFIAYASRTELSGHVLKYTRTLEIKELSVPAAKAEQLKAFYRAIENDERTSAVLKRVLP